MSAAVVRCQFNTASNWLSPSRRRQPDSGQHRTPGPLIVVAANALTMKARKGGRVIKVVVLPATGVIGDGNREVLGMRVATSGTGLA
jgi:Transposase, Mutator family